MHESDIELFLAVFCFIDARNLLKKNEIKIKNSTQNMTVVGFFILVRP